MSQPPIIHPGLDDAFAALQQHALRWSLLRGEDELADPQGDVDLLIERSDLRRATRILENQGFLRVPAWGQGSHTFFFRHEPATGGWLKLDIVTELAFGRSFTLRTWAESGCLQRRRQEGSLALLAADDAFWSLLLHCLLDKGRFAPQQAKRLQELVPEADQDSPLARLVARYCPAGWDVPQLLERVRQGHWQELEGLAAALARTWAARQPAPPRLRRFAGKVRGLAARIWFRLRRRGLSVALLGPDGAGKSTLATNIQGDFWFPVKSLYMGQRPRSGRRLPIPGMEIATRLGSLWWRYLQARYHQQLGRLVLFDRYTFDALLAPRHNYTWQERLYWGLLERAIPAPDLVLVLDAPGEVMFARKGEHSPAMLEEQRQRFLALLPRIPHAEVVDVARPEAEVRRDVTGRIWRRYHAHWSGR